MAVRTLIVDDQQLVRDGIASLLALQPDIDIVGMGANGRECVALAGELDPDVILLDIRMPEMDGIAAAEELKQRGVRARVLMLTTFDDEEYVVKSLRAGAVGYLMKDVPPEELGRAVLQANSGTFQFAPGVVGTLMGGMEAKQARPSEPDADIQSLYDALTERERDVLRVLGRGHTNREIADELYLSEGTVKNYVSSILTAFDFRDRTQAGLAAVKYGWDR